LINEHEAKGRTRTEKLSSDTAAFAVDSIRRGWYAEGMRAYADSEKIVLTADCGRSNGNRNRLWKLELQKLADEIGKGIQVFIIRRKQANGTKSSVACSRSSAKIGKASHLQALL
jgi:hypothetical protein